MLARILTVYWVIGSQFWDCKSRRQSSLDCWHPETYALSTPSMNHFCLWCSEVNCWQEQIHKFKTEYLLIWQKYLSTWTSIKYFGHQVQVSTKYFWISKGQVQVSTKYSIIRIKYQVQVLYLTPTLHIISFSWIHVIFLPSFRHGAGWRSGWSRWWGTSPWTGKIQDSRFKHHLFRRNTDIHIYITIMDTWQNMFLNGNMI